MFLFNFSNFANHRGIEQSVARWAHNPKVAGSSPAPATIEDGQVFFTSPFLLESSLPLVNEWINLNIGFKFEVRYFLSFGSKPQTWQDYVVSYKH